MFALIPNWIKTGLAAIVVLVVVAGMSYYFGTRSGAASVKAEWNAAIARDLANAVKAKKDADLSVPELTLEDRIFDRDLPAHSQPCLVRHEWDRDCDTVRSVR